MTKEDLKVNGNIDGLSGPGIYNRNLLKFIGAKVGKQ